MNVTTLFKMKHALLSARIRVHNIANSMWILTFIKGLILMVYVQKLDLTGKREIVSCENSFSGHPWVYGWFMT